MQILNTTWVPQFMNEIDQVSFNPDWWEYKRGNAMGGNAWYWPRPSTTHFDGLDWEWVDGGVNIRCEHVQFLLVSFDWQTKVLPELKEGYAVVLEPPGGDGCGGGGGGGGGGSEDPIINRRPADRPNFDCGGGGGGGGGGIECWWDHVVLQVTYDDINWITIWEGDARICDEII